MMYARVGSVLAILILAIAILYQTGMAHTLTRSLLPTLQRSTVYNRTLPLISELVPKLNSFVSSRPYPPLLASNPFSSTTNMASQKSFIDAVKSRRTYYALNKQPPISDDQITQLVNDTVLHVPSSFNSQSTRAVVLLKDQHDKFWDFVIEVLKPMLSGEEQLKSSTARINGFKAGYGTVSP